MIIRYIDKKGRGCETKTSFTTDDGIDTTREVYIEGCNYYHQERFSVLHKSLELLSQENEELKDLLITIMKKDLLCKTK